MPQEVKKPFGKYNLLERIAVGGTAEIFLAKTSGVDGFEKTVVIKKILVHWAKDPEFIQMLIDEAKIAVLLSHSNIAQVFDLGFFEEDYFIAMEYLDGLDLKTLINQANEKGAKIPADVACYIALQVAEGLDYAHKRVAEDGTPLQIVHRDVSPHNILLSYHGDVKITDFGIAKAAVKKSLTSTGMLKGKFSYMSPEQVRCEPLSGQSDLFSLGVVLYEMLTGKKCFDGESEVTILDKIRNVQLSLETLPEEIPTSLKEILRKALAGNLAERYPSAEAMQNDLARALIELAPGFREKNLADFLNDYRKVNRMQESNSSTTSTPSTPPPSNSGLSGAPPSPPPPPGGSNPEGRPPKKKLSLLWIIYWLILLLGIGFVGYLIWKEIVQPLRKEMKQIKTGIELRTSPTPSAMPKPSAAPTPTPWAQPTPSPSATPTPFPFAAPSPTPSLRDPFAPLQTPAPLPPAATVQPIAPQNPWGNPNPQPSAAAPLIPGGQTIQQTPLSPDAPVPPQASSSPQAQTGTLQLSSTPPGAEVWLDGKETGLKTPVTLQQIQLYVGHEIQLKLPGYEPWKRTFTLVNPAPLVLSGELVQAPAKSPFGQALIVSNPPGAQVYMNNVPTGLVTPATLTGLPLNQPTKIRLIKKGYLAVEGIYTPMDGTLQTIELPMKAQPRRRRASDEGGDAPGYRSPRGPYVPPSGGGTLYLP